MAYYDALIAKWATLSGTTEAKLAAINALTVAGPNVDVPVSAVVGYLGENLKLAKLQAYATAAMQAPAPTEAQIAGAELMALFGMGINAPAFRMSDPTKYANMQALLTALAGDTASGIVTADVTALLALSATTIPWWQATVTQDGGGLSSTVSQADLDAAGGLS